MMKPISLVFALSGLIVVNTVISPVEAAKPSSVAAALPDAANTLHGKVEYLDLGKNLIVINDREYLLPASVPVNGRNGARHSLFVGMRVTFSVAPGNGRPVIQDISSSK